MWQETFKNSTIVLAGVVSSRFFVFLFNMVIIRQLSVKDYALFAYAFSVFNWVLIFAHFDLYAAISRQISYLKALDRSSEIQQYYDHARILVSGLSVTGVIIAFSIANQEAYDKGPLFIFMVALIPVALFTVNDGYFKGFENYFFAAMVDAANGFSKFFFIGIALLFWDHLSLNQVFFLFFAAAVSGFFISSLVLQRYMSSPPKKVFLFEKKTFFNLLDFSKWVCITDLMNTGIILIGNLILSRYSTTDLARFNLVVLFYSVFQIGFGSITTVLIPQVSKKIAKKEKITLLGWDTLAWLSLVTAILIGSLLLLPYQTDILNFFFHKTEYGNTFNYLCILLIAFPFRIITMTNKGVLQGVGRPELMALVSAITLIAYISLFIPLYTLLGLWGAFAAMVCSYVVEFFLTIAATKREQKEAIEPAA